MALRHAETYRQYRGHELITPPATEPVTLAELGVHLRTDFSGEDQATQDYIEGIITACREQAEEVTGRALITQSWRMTLDHWPGNREPWWGGVRQMAISELHGAGRASWVILPRYRLQTVDKLEVFDTGGNATAITVSDDFIVDTQQEPGRMVLKTGATWPVALQRANAIQIEYTAGYGDNASDVPRALRHAILMMAANMYEHRGDDCSMEDAMRMSGAGTVFKRYSVREI